MRNGRIGTCVLVILLAFLWHAPLHAQVCDAESIARKPSGWKKREDYVPPDVRKEPLSRAKAVVSDIGRMLTEEVYPQPRGCNPTWRGDYNGGGPYPSFSYSFESGYFMYYCKPSGKEMYVGAETETWITVQANNSGVLNGNMELNGKRFLTMRRHNEIRDGMLYYEIPRTETAPRTRDTNMTYAWLVTYPGKLPYLPVSRKEYLLEAMKEVQKKQQQVVAAMQKTTVIRPAAEQAAQKKKRIDEIEKGYTGNAREARINRYLKDYRTDEQRKQDAIDAVSANYRKTLELMDGLLRNMTENELRMPAVMQGPANGFQGFRDDTPHIHMLVRPDPDYFDKRLSRATPQFFTVVALEEARMPASREVVAAFVEKFRFERLKQMLGN
jgi:hypothetical protein